MLRMASSIDESGKRYFTISLRGRRPDISALTYVEAQAMLLVGFRFTRFDRKQAEFDLRSPYEFAHFIDRDTLTFAQ